MDRYNNNLAFGIFSKYKFGKSDNANGFGALIVPSGMRPVSSFRNQDRPLLTAPFGPIQPWMAQGHEGAASSGFGSSSLAGRKVNPSGYLALRNAQPRSLPPSWNPLLMQGGNYYVQGDNTPMLSSVVSKFGVKKKAKKTVKRKPAGKTAAKKTVKRKSAVKKTKKRS